MWSLVGGLQIVKWFASSTLKKLLQDNRWADAYGTKISYT